MLDGAQVPTERDILRGHISASPGVSAVDPLNKLNDAASKLKCAIPHISHLPFLGPEPAGG